MLVVAVFSNVLLVNCGVLLQARTMTGDMETTRITAWISAQPGRPLLRVHQMRRKVRQYKTKTAAAADGHFDLAISHLKTKYKRNLEIKYINLQAFRSVSILQCNILAKKTM